MTAQPKLNHDLKLIRDEASKVIEDLSHLGKVLAEVGEDRSQELTNKVEGVVERELQDVKKRLEVITSQIAATAKEADKHVRANPYWYALGSLGVGMVLGKMLSPRFQE